QHVARLREADADGLIQRDHVGRGAVARGALERPDERRDDAGLRIDPPDPMMVRVGDQHRAVGRERDAGRRVERGGRRRAAVADATAGDGMDVHDVLRARRGREQRADDGTDAHPARTIHGPSYPSAARRPWGGPSVTEFFASGCARPPRTIRMMVWSTMPRSLRSVRRSRYARLSASFAGKTVST